jgi:glucose-1-phosphate thymidylyltransferase
MQAVDMDAVLLAGGYATRLWPITRNRPKMFLPIGDGTVIDRILRDLEGDDRIDRVLISTNREFAEEFRGYLAASAFEKPTVSVEETSFEGEKLGVVGALAQLIDRENVTDDLLVVAGDNYIGYDLSTFVDAFEQRDAPTLAAHDVGSLDRARSYGVVTLEDERVVDFQEKPENPESTLVSIACYAFPGDALGLFEEYLESGNNPDEPGWFIQWLQNRVPTYAFPFDDAWFDIGEPEAYLETVAFHLDGDAKVASGATVTDSEIGENVLILEDAKVTDASLAETVVFSGAEITGATLEGSIVDEEAVVDGIDLSGSLVGAYTRLSD